MAKGNPGFYCWFTIAGEGQLAQQTRLESLASPPRELWTSTVNRRMLGRIQFLGSPHPAGDGVILQQLGLLLNRCVRLVADGSILRQLGSLFNSWVPSQQMRTPSRATGSVLQQLGLFSTDGCVLRQVSSLYNSWVPSQQIAFLNN